MIRSTICSLFALVLLSSITRADQSLTNPQWKLSKVPVEFKLADGAGWDGRSRLFVPDVKGGKLLLLDLRDTKKSPRVVLNDVRISGCCYQRGRLYVSDNGNSRIAVLDEKKRELTTLVQLDPKNRPNDLVVDSQGNVFVTVTRTGVVRRISSDHKGDSEIVVRDLTAPNGIALSPDESCLYVSSVKTGLISKITIQPDISEYKATDFAQLAETKTGFKGDGMCVDRAGNVYVTGAEAVSVFDPSGNLVSTIKTPERPINAIIGGVEGWTLYVSTFGGLYQQRLNTYGVSPDPGTDLPETTVRSKAVQRIESKLNVVYSQRGDRKLRMDLFTPVSDDTTPRPAIVVVHGGGWAKGDKTKFRELAMRLAARGWITAAIEYRLAFEAKFPAAIHDCNAAASFLKENARRLGIDPNRIGAVGGSAGGHLVGLMASGHNDPQLRHADTQGSLKLAAAVVMAGPMQIATGSVADKSRKPEVNSNAINWIGDTIDNLPEMYSLADAHNKIDATTTPILFLCGSLDNPSRNNLSREKMKSVGVQSELVVHPDAKHGHWNRPDWIGKVVDDIDAFFVKKL